MKRVLLIFSALLFSTVAFSQDPLYLVFELMEVDNEQEVAYAETEAFWEKIHQQRANNGNIIGWDLWQLLPGGEDQGYQYATVTLYSSAPGMFEGGDFWKNAQKAYPKMSEKQLDAELNKASKSRDLAVRIYMERIAGTNDDFDMKIGTVASFDWMKVEMGQWSEYEAAEKEVFMPMHQNQVDNGAKGSWGLMRFISPVGSDTYASHLTVNMFDSFDQYFSSWEGPELPKMQQMAVQQGLDMRDMRKSNMARLVRKVRKK